MEGYAGVTAGSARVPVRGVRRVSASPQPGPGGRSRAEARGRGQGGVSVLGLLRSCSVSSGLARGLGVASGSLAFSLCCPPHCPTTPGRASLPPGLLSDSRPGSTVSALQGDPRAVGTLCVGPALAPVGAVPAASPAPRRPPPTVSPAPTLQGEISAPPRGSLVGYRS